MDDLCDTVCNSGLGSVAVTMVDPLMSCWLSQSGCLSDSGRIPSAAGTRTERRTGAKREGNEETYVLFTKSRIKIFVTNQNESRTAKKVFILVIAVFTMSLMVGCAGMKEGPEDRRGYLYYPSALVKAYWGLLMKPAQQGRTRDVAEFNAAKDMVDKAYEYYMSCRGDRKKRWLWLMTP